MSKLRLADATIDVVVDDSGNFALFLAIGPEPIHGEDDSAFPMPKERATTRCANISDLIGVLALELDSRVDAALRRGTRGL